MAREFTREARVLVLISVIVAYYFVTQIAEWTTWTMLVFMAITICTRC